MHKMFCDACEKPLKHERSCDGHRDGEYHFSCLKQMNGSLYCDNCSKSRLDNYVLTSYLKKTLKGLNIGGKIRVDGVIGHDDDDCRVHVQFGKDAFSFKASWQGWNKTLYLHHKDYYWKVKLHQHAMFRRSLKEVIISVLFTELASIDNRVKSWKQHIKEHESVRIRFTALHKTLMGKEKFSPKGLVPHRKEE